MYSNLGTDSEFSKGGGGGGQKHCELEARGPLRPVGVQGPWSSRVLDVLAYI